ncbi:hypothetical protein NQ317_017147, partial [Molorchus minor]
MAPPKRQANYSDQETVVPTASVTMTNEQFLSLINELRESAKISRDDLLGNIRDQASPPSSGVPSGVQTGVYTGNFAKCTARFNGSDSSDVDAFADCILTYKDCTNVSDDNALRGLAMLLEGAAATWWQGVKATVSDWNSAVKLLKDTFSKTLPSHLIYREIFSREQSADETTELFVSRIRALISKLSYELPAEAQLDMIYGLLHRKIRKRLPRDNFEDFNTLLKKSRDIERSLKELTDKRDYNENSEVDSTRSEVKSQERKKPLLPISISNISGVGFADSGAQISIAGSTLYDLLKHKGYTFEESQVHLSYADGVVREENVLTTSVDVGIKDRVVPFKFTILPHLQNNHTLLGVDFFKKAKVVLNIPEESWFFSDDPKIHYPFINEYCIPANVQVFELGKHSLRNDEAVSLNSSQRETLNEIL